MGRPPGDEFKSLKECSKLIEATQLVLEGKDERSSLDLSVMDISTALSFFRNNPEVHFP